MLLFIDFDIIVCYVHSCVYNPVLLCTLIIILSASSKMEHRIIVTFEGGFEKVYSRFTA